MRLHIFALSITPNSTFRNGIYKQQTSCSTATASTPKMLTISPRYSASLNPLSNSTIWGFWRAEAKTFFLNFTFDPELQKYSILLKIFRPQTPPPFPSSQFWPQNLWSTECLKFWMSLFPLCYVTMLIWIAYLQSDSIRFHILKNTIAKKYDKKKWMRNSLCWMSSSNVIGLGQRKKDV